MAISRLCKRRGGSATPLWISRIKVSLSLLGLLVSLSWLPQGDASSISGFSQIPDSMRDRMQPISLACPPEREILPCKCQLRGPEIHVKCENSVLEKVMRALETLMKMVIVIEELHLIGNRIHILPARVFGSLQVTKVFLINNELVGINRNAFAGLESSLQHLYITDPQLFNVPFDIFDTLFNLKTCVLENTDINEIPRLFSLSKLEFLKIDGSRITTIPTSAFRFMPSMKKVHIANSLLKDIPENALEGLVYLKEVNFSNNVISWIHPRAFRTLTMVEQLTLSGNDIVDANMAVLAAKDLRELRIFDLSHNKIVEVVKNTFVDMPTVQVINLSYNLISRIEHGAFFRLPAVAKIDIKGNKLDEFNVDIFTEIVSVEHLNIAKNNLTFMAEMTYIARVLPNLRSFDVSGNHLKAENFRNIGGHRKLEALKMDHNELGKLQKGMFKDLPNLRELYLSHNSIKTTYNGQIWNLPKLRVLDISHNDLEIVDVLLLEGVSSLSNLDLSFNMIANIGGDAFMNLRYLEKLNMSFNSITMIPKNAFFEMKDLFELELSFNELISLENSMFNGLNSLQYLHATHNQILTIESNVFKDTPELKHLDLSSNFIQNIPKEALSHLISLATLKLNQNVINDIQDGQLHGLRIVEHLDLSNNHIQAMSPSAFRDMSVLRDLDLSSNFVQALHPHMFTNTKLLEKLNVSHNYITDLGSNTFTNSKRLRILDITNNSLTTLGDQVQNLMALQGLFISHNYITHLNNSTFKNLPNLNVLKFDNNGLQTFDPATFSDMESLLSLNLQNNNLIEINPDSVMSLHALNELQLGRNQISVIKDFAFSDLTSLRSLELQDNIITNIGDHAFQNMPSLNFLNLSRNGLQNIPADALSRLPALDVLDLSWNYLLEIGDDSFHHLEYLTVLLLHNNDVCHLSNNAFSQQRSLRILTLQNNQLRHLHLNALGSVITGLSLLDMSGNPFRCDCELLWLKEYLNEDPNDHRIPRTAILGESLRGVPVCASPAEYEGMPITEVPADAFMCTSRLIPGGEDDACAPRFLDPLLFTESQQVGSGADPNAVISLLQLSNLSVSIPEGATGPSYLDVNNPIHIHNFDGVKLPQKNKTGIKPPVTAGVVNNVVGTELANDPQKDQQQLVSSSSIHSVTGDTPTIYAGANSGNPADNIKVQGASSSNIFGGLNLPNILESITNLNLPHIGLNVNWGNLPIGRQESGALDIGQMSETIHPPGEKPMKGPDGNKPIWINGPVSPHPLFPAPPLPAKDDSPPLSPARGPGAVPSTQDILGLVAPGVRGNRIPGRDSAPSITFPVEDEQVISSVAGTVTPVTKPTNIWRVKPRPGQVEAIRPIHWPTQIKTKGQSLGQSFFPTSHQGSKSVLPPVAHSGPGPSSGKPFSPGLTSHHPQHVLPMIVNQGARGDALVPLLSLHSPASSNKDTSNSDPINVAQATRGGIWQKPQWSHPEVIHPDSGVSLYQPGEPFQPFHPEDPNHPITIVDAPNISVLHKGAPTTPRAITLTTAQSQGLVISTTSAKPHPDMDPSETQVIGGPNFFPDSQKHELFEKPLSSLPVQSELGNVTQTQYFLTPGNQDTEISSSPNTVGNERDEPSITGYPDVNQFAEIPAEVQNIKPISQKPLEVQEDTDSGPSLGDLLDLLYAAEEEVHEEDFVEDSQSSDDTDSLTLIDQDTLWLPEESSVTTNLTNLSHSRNHEGYVPFSSTTETLALRSTSPRTTSTTINYIPSSTEPILLKTIAQEAESEKSASPYFIPPRLGNGVTILEDVAPIKDIDSHLIDSNFPQNNQTIAATHDAESQLQSYKPISLDDNDDHSYLPPAEKPIQDDDWNFSSERPPLISSTTSRTRPGFVVPVDKSGDPLPGANVRQNVTHYISPSKSIGRGGIPTIERIESPNFQHRITDGNRQDASIQAQVDIPEDKDSTLIDIDHRESIRNTEADRNDVHAIDWYYSNYFREYDPYAPLPVGGNKPSNSGSTSTKWKAYTWFLTTMLIVHKFVR